MAKVDRIVELLERRIAQGDYALRPVPAETTLADETGVSRMTARKAVIRLVERGLLTRAPNGRLTVNLTSSPSGKSEAPGPAERPVTATPLTRFAFAAPAHGSAEIDRWRVAADHCVAEASANLRIVHFHHWDDPVLTETVSSFDGVFLIPPAEGIPKAVAERLRSGRARLVALDCDLTAYGIRSVDLVPPNSVHRLLDHLAALGHRKIHCFNSQPMDSVVQDRIEQWSLWLAAQGASGSLINEPDVSYGDPARRGYEAMSQRLAEGPLNATAVMCVTMPAALGAMRAMYERGLQVGKDISLCAANDEGLASYLCPSLTATRMPDPAPYLKTCLNWMRDADYVGPLLMRPVEVPLFIGESTGPVPKKIR